MLDESGSSRTADLPSTEAVEQLYCRALAEQWNVERDVDWSALCFDGVAKPIRRAMLAIYSHVYHAESFGLGLCGRLVDVTPAGPLRQFAATQVMDEARHVDFFARVMALLGDGAPLVPPGLAALSRDMAPVRDDLRLLLYGQVIENAAQTLFIEAARVSREKMRAAIKLPGSAPVNRLLDYIIRLVGRDEARHIAYGQSVLAERLSDLSPAARRGLEREAGAWCACFQASFAQLEGETQRVGLSAHEVLRKAARTQGRQFRRLGLAVELPAGECEEASGEFGDDA